jgi:hypothetical protein
MDYGQALSGLASGMAGEEGGAGMGGDMMPCPMCQGAGAIPAAMLAGEGLPAVPPRLAARGGGGMMGGAPMGGGQMSAPMSMGA